MLAHDRVERHLCVACEVTGKGSTEMSKSLPCVPESTISAERRLSGEVARRVLALVGAGASSSAVWVDETCLFDVPGAFPTDLILRGRKPPTSGVRKVSERTGGRRGRKNDRGH